MSDQEWETFFQLLQKVTNQPVSPKEKLKLMLEKAEKYGENVKTALREFTNYKMTT